MNSMKPLEPIKPITLDEVEQREQELEEKGKKKKKKESDGENSVDTILAALADFGYTFVYNELSKEAEIIDDEGNINLLDDYIFSRIIIQLWREGYKISEGTLHRIIMGAAAEPYHPIKKYFESLPVWDGTDHIAALAKIVQIEDMGIGLRAKWPEYLKKWLVAAAAQATIEKATNHTCLVLVGGQGLGKTTFLNALCPEPLVHLRYSGHIRVGEKDTENLLAERFLINIDDQLDLMHDLKKLKSMFTMEKVVNRKAYTKFSPSRPRIASFVASVNSTQFLTDDENRRYLIVFVNDIYLDKLHMVNREQLWAQVKYLLESGFRYWFDKEENSVISRVNDMFRIRTEEEELITKYFEKGEEPMMQTEIFDYLQSRTNAKLNSKKLTEALKKLGFVRKSARLENSANPLYVYMMSKVSNFDEKQKERKVESEKPQDSGYYKHDQVPF